MSNREISQDLIKRAINTLEEVSLSWSVLKETAQEIILYGSRAVGVERESSDWDFLCVGYESDFRAAKVHIKWYSPEFMLSEKWLGSELAGHISKYGVWLKGNPKWLSKVYVSKQALHHKEKLICGHLSGLRKAWPYLEDNYRAFKYQKVRRHLQRFERLRNKLAVPPTAILDKEWDSLTSSRKEFLEILKNLKCYQEHKEFCESVLFETV